MRGVRILNAVLALVAELLLLGAFVWIGLASAGPPVARVALAIALPVLVIAAWSALMAPRARRRLPEQTRVIVEAALFGVAVLGLAAVGLVLPAVLLAVLAAVRLVLGARLGAV